MRGTQINFDLLNDESSKCVDTVGQKINDEELLTKTSRFRPKVKATSIMIVNR